VANAVCVGLQRDLPGYRPDYYSLRQEFARAKFVVEATAQRETWLDLNGKPTRLKPPFRSGGKLPLGFDPYADAYYDVVWSAASKAIQHGAFVCSARTRQPAFD
jgi:hypothetical protein